MEHWMVGSEHGNRPPIVGAHKEVWEPREPVFLAWNGRTHARYQKTSPYSRPHSQASSAAEPACVQSARRLCSATLQVSAREFVNSLENAAYAREENPQQATLLRELVDSLSSGVLLLMPTDEVWDLEEEKREEKAIKKLDKLIEFVVIMRKEWIASPLGRAPWNADRGLEALEGEMSIREADQASREVLGSMTTEKRAEYAFCLDQQGAQQFFFALLRQPSFFKAEGLEKLLEEWVNIKRSPEYRAVIENSKRRTELVTKQKAELQNLRMRINRKRQNGESTQDLLRELEDKKKSYAYPWRCRLGPTPPPLERPLRSRLELDRIPPKLDRRPPFVLNWSHEITPELDVDWTLSEDTAKELSLRDERNEIIKKQLQLGRPVIYRSSGWSLWPRVWPNDQCTYEPVTSADDVRKTDIVFCQVQPGDRFYGHIVSHKWFQDGKWYFSISNLNGWLNGWCAIEHIYGRLIRCQR